MSDFIKKAIDFFTRLCQYKHKEVITTLNNSDQLKKIRKEKKLTIQAVSDGAGIPPRTYQNYEYGKREISAEALYKLADFYGVTTDYLLGREHETDEQLNTIYQKLTPEGKKFINKLIGALANSHKTENEQNDRHIILATIGEMLITLSTESINKKVEKK